MEAIDKLKCLDEGLPGMGKGVENRYKCTECGKVTAVRDRNHCYAAHTRPYYQEDGSLLTFKANIMCDPPLQGGLGCGKVTEQSGVRIPIDDEKYMWIQADLERDARISIGNKTEVGSKGQLEAEYELGKRKVDYEVVVEIWRRGLTRDRGHYIIVKNKEAKGAWQAWEDSEDPKPKKGEDGKPITAEEYVVVARLVRFEYQEVDKREVVQVGSQDEREAEQSRGTPMTEEQTKQREERECGNASPCLKDKLVLTPYGVLGAQHTETGQIEQVAMEPTLEAGIAIVDPAGMPFIQNGPRGAEGASSAIYH